MKKTIITLCIVAGCLFAGNTKSDSGTLTQSAEMDVKSLDITESSKLVRDGWRFYNSFDKDKIPTYEEAIKRFQESEPRLAKSFNLHIGESWSRNDKEAGLLGADIRKDLSPFWRIYDLVLMENKSKRD